MSGRFWSGAAFQAYWFSVCVGHPGSEGLNRNGQTAFCKKFCKKIKKGIDNIRNECYHN